MSSRVLVAGARRELAERGAYPSYDRVMEPATGWRAFLTRTGGKDTFR
jgi:hypothetical protein